MDGGAGGGDRSIEGIEGRADWLAGGCHYDVIENTRREILYMYVYYRYNVVGRTTCTRPYYSCSRSGVEVELMCAACAVATLHVLHVETIYMYQLSTYKYLQFTLPHDKSKLIFPSFCQDSE